MLSKWIKCLPREERQEVEIDKTFFPIPRNIMMNKISQGLDLLYGKGKKRIMRPGEEASIIETIDKVLEDCKNDFTILALNGVQSLIKRVLRRSDLEELLEFPLCMK